MTTSSTPAVDFSPALGAPTDWRGTDGPEFQFWRTDVLEVLVAEGGASDGQLRAAYRRRAIGQTPVLIAAPDVHSAGITRTVGPLSPDGPPRRIPQHALEQAVASTQRRSRRTAAAYLESELGRLDGAEVPGITFNGLLTAHTMKRIQQDGGDRRGLNAGSEHVVVSASWRDNFTAIGYDLRQERDFWRLERASRTIALLQPHSDETFLGAEGKTVTLPAGKLISDCLAMGVDWGIMASNQRWRLYRVEHPTGSAVANYLGICQNSGHRVC